MSLLPFLEPLSLIQHRPLPPSYKVIARIHLAASKFNRTWTPNQTLWPNAACCWSNQSDRPKKNKRRLPDPDCRSFTETLTKKKKDYTGLKQLPVDSLTPPATKGNNPWLKDTKQKLTLKSNNTTTHPRKTCKRDKQDCRKGWHPKFAKKIEKKTSLLEEKHYSRRENNWIIPRGRRERDQARRRERRNKWERKCEKEEDERKNKNDQDQVKKGKKNWRTLKTENEIACAMRKEDQSDCAWLLVIDFELTFAVGSQHWTQFATVDSFHIILSPQSRVSLISQIICPPNFFSSLLYSP